MYGQLPKIATKANDGTDGPEIEGFPISIRYPKKLAVLRLPTTAELTPFFNSQRVVVTSIGRGKSTSDDMTNTRAELTLFNLLRMDKNGDEFDDAEIRKALGEITFHRVLSCIHDGDLFVVSLSTPFDDKDESTGERLPIVHTLREPTQAEAERYRKGMMTVTDLPDNRQEQRFPVTVPGDLFDAIVRTSAGYAPSFPVPIHHKKSVVNTLMHKLALEELDTTDPN